MKELCFNNGDTYLFLEEISNMLSNYVSISNEKFDYLMVKLVKNKKIIIEDKRYYLRKFYEAEKYICERLCFLNDMSINSNISIDKYIDNKEVDFVIYVTKGVEDFPKTESIGTTYKLVAHERQRFEGRMFDYYLYELGEA